VGGSCPVDLRDRTAVFDAVTAARPEIVFHFAAQSLVREAFRRPADTFAVNVMGTVNLLDALLTCRDLRTLVTATTDKVYRNVETSHAYAETDPLGGLEPYSASKAATEMVIAAYRTSYFSPRRVASFVCRAGNVVGGGDWAAHRLIPDAIRAVQAGRPLAVRHPASVRPWLFVLDAIEGYLMLAERAASLTQEVILPSDAAWNFGPDSASPRATVADVCGWMMELWPERFAWRAEADSEGIAESRLLSLDPAKAMRVLGWRPRLDPREAVRHTLDWYRGFLSGKDAYDLCSEQIRWRFPDLA
jgi:CDP-glucose 4,6-dehydratase